LPNCRVVILGEDFLHLREVAVAIEAIQSILSHTHPHAYVAQAIGQAGNCTNPG
jgi:hypothetical protein